MNEIVLPILNWHFIVCLGYACTASADTEYVSLNTSISSEYWPPVWQLRALTTQLRTPRCKLRKHWPLNFNNFVILKIIFSFHACYVYVKSNFREIQLQNDNYLLNNHIIVILAIFKITNIHQIYYIHYEITVC